MTDLEKRSAEMGGRFFWFKFFGSGFWNTDL
jgi:hypothetical protein